jgi:hypothetical protein
LHRAVWTESSPQLAARKNQPPAPKLLFLDAIGGAGLAFPFEPQPLQRLFTSPGLPFNDLLFAYFVIHLIATTICRPDHNRSIFRILNHIYYVVSNATLSTRPPHPRRTPRHGSRRRARFLTLPRKLAIMPLRGRKFLCL